MEIYGKNSLVDDRPWTQKKNLLGDHHHHLLRLILADPRDFALRANILAGISIGTADQCFVR